MAKKTILIADTDVPLLQALAIGLRSGGYEVALAQNTDQAIERFRSHGPELLLLGTALPDALTRLREHGAGASTPVVLLAGEPTERLDPAVRRDAVAVLHKPFDAKTLLATVGEALGTAVRATHTL